jgi:hypothetical protein
MVVVCRMALMYHQQQTFWSECPYGTARLAILYTSMILDIHKIISPYEKWTIITMLNNNTQEVMKRIDNYHRELLLKKPR